MLPTAPNETYRAILSDHMEMDNPPVFLFPYLTGRQQRVLLGIKSVIAEDQSGYDTVFDTVKEYLTGWENIGIEFNVDMLDDVVSYSQLLELLSLLVYQSPSIDAKKKSKSE